MKKDIFTLIGFIVVLILILVSFFGPWYTTNTKYKMESLAPPSDFNMTHSPSYYEETDYTVGYYLTKIQMKGTMFDKDLEQSIDYSLYKQQLKQAPAWAQTSPMTNIFDIFDYTMSITVAVILVSILALICTIVTILPIKYHKTMRNLGIIFGTITCILAIAAVIYFMLEWNNMLSEWSTYVISEYDSSSPSELADMGFWYSYSSNGGEYSMGPGFAWYLMIIAGIIALFSSISLYIKRIPLTPETLQSPYHQAYPPME